MGRRIGKIQKLPSGDFRASFMGPDGARVFAAVTFPLEGDADTWLATQRTDLIRGTWKAPDVGAPLLGDYAASWPPTRSASMGGGGSRRGQAGRRTLEWELRRSRSASQRVSRARKAST